MGIFEVKDVFQIAGRGVVVVGIVRSGEISKGMWGNIDGIKVKILSIETWKKEVSDAKEGEQCGLLLEGIKKEGVKERQVIHFKVPKK
jgi:translation elongation factor EF-Tu-like GTPase